MKRNERTNAKEIIGRTSREDVLTGTDKLAGEGQAN